MSNERIDLTQFEGISEDLEGEIYFLLKYADPYKPKVVDALIHLPKLITELKRMYEREDELMEILSILEDRHDIDMSQFDASE